MHLSVSLIQRLSLDPNEQMAIHKKETAQLYATIQENINSPDPVWKIKPLPKRHTTATKGTNLVE